MRERSLLTHFPVVAAVVAVLLTVSAATAGERIVAVGDVHGSYTGLVAILQRVGLIDSETHWIGGDATFVQTGDLFDRGLEVRKVLDLLMRLDREAADAGGRVIVLLGNHEGMNLIGFYRDVNPEIYSTFAGDDSEKLRKAAFKDYKTYLSARAKAMGVAAPPVTSEVKDRWMAAFPPGWLEYNQALGPDGVYGAWLRKLPVAVVIDGVLFIHGGIGPDLEGLSVDQINAEVAAELATYDRVRKYMVEQHLVPSTAGLQSLVSVYSEQDPADPELDGLADVDQWFVHSPGGPLWFRGAARWDESADAERMAALLAGVGAERVVSGHTVQREGQIETRFGGSVFLIDTGMLETHYDGRPSALVIEDGSFTAIYTDGTSEVLVDEALPKAA
jgi:hypothetical protein